jgi:hypothetical protein
MKTSFKSKSAKSDHSIIITWRGEIHITNIALDNLIFLCCLECLFQEDERGPD